MTNEQLTALKFLLKRYAEASFETSEATEKSPSRYNLSFAEEQLAEKEIIEFIDCMINNLVKSNNHYQNFINKL